MIGIGGQIYINDFLDILIIALFIYSIFLLFRRTRTYLVALGLIIIVSFYVLANSFNLYLTSRLLQYFVGASIVLFAIIFQSEIRKYFELLGIIGTRQIKVGKLAPKSPTIAEIVQSTVKMAQSKVGALIVIRGKDSLDTLIQGGVALDGIISEEVILSIFDPHSEGHDGAVVIDNNRITFLGVQLPLSTNFKEIGRHGTRHSAAIGLSERCDCLCVVVSEEKGQISIARDGKLKTLEDFTDLEKELDRYIKSKFTAKADSFLRHIVKHNFWLKTGALTSAAIIWFFSAYRAGVVHKDYLVPVSFDRLPQEILIDSYNPHEVKLTVSGRGEFAFSNISSSNFAVTVDASNFHSGIQQVQLTAKHVDWPLNLTFESIDPEIVLLTAHKFVTVEVPITVKIQGQPPTGFSLSQVTVTPQMVAMRLPETAPFPTEILTETIDVAKLQESVIIPVKLLLPADSQLIKGEPTASVALTIE